MLDVTNLSYQIRNRTLLDGISFRATPGRLLAILGANGAGKSTLLKLCSGELQPSTGEVNIRNRPLRAYSEKELALFRAVLPQQNGVVFPFLVHELVMMGRYPHFQLHASDEDYHIASQALQKVGMEAFASRVFTTLSGGEQQRVQLARVLAQVWDTQEGLLFLDEPTTGLDLLHQHQLLAMARSLAHEGHCVIMIVHDLNLAAQYADDILMLKSGKLAAVGKPREVLRAEIIRRVFNLDVWVGNHPEVDCPMIVPQPLQVTPQSSFQ